MVCSSCFSSPLPLLALVLLLLLLQLSQFVSLQRLGSDSSCRNENQSYYAASTEELVRSKGLPFEKHFLISQNGYILQLDRIPPPPATGGQGGGRGGKSRGKGSGKVVILVHGMTQSSRDWFIQCEKRGLGFKLADAGHDVWLANIRGNTYSNRHIKYSSDEVAYWNFTVDELIKYDAPLTVDYILNTTAGSSKGSLIWIGYSLGSAIAMGLMSSQPEYNSKINLFISLGTVAYVGHTSNRVLKFLARYQKIEEEYFMRRTGGKLFSDRTLQLYKRYIPFICRPEVELNLPLVCYATSGFLFGFDLPQANPRLMAILASGTPGQWGVKVLLQWFQWIQSDRFSYYDYEPQGNLDKYGSVSPPEYNISLVTTRVVNFWSENDHVAVPQDVKRVVAELPNVVANIQVDFNGWSHLDYAYGKDADKYVYNHILTAINKYGG